MKPLRTALLTLSISAMSIGGAACQGALTDEAATVGEAAAALTVAEESGDVTADMVALESSAELTAGADQSAALPPATTDADGVCDFGAQRQRIVAQYDTNGDGRLDVSERAALKADLGDRVNHPLAARFALGHRMHVLARLRWAFDEDFDGALSDEERAALVDALEARCLRVREAVMAKFDANADGTLDATERQAAKDALVARLQAKRQELLAKYDTNLNGVLDAGERLQLRADIIDAWQAKKAQLIATYDVNGDGVLDQTEKLALKKALQQRIAEGRDAQ
jgi:regulator of sigma D